MMSLLGSKSGKAAKTTAKVAKPAKPAAPTAARGVLVEKPSFNIYTMLLILSFVAIAIGCVCLYAEMSAYNFEIKPRI
jgi:hypothetical protein